MFRRFVRHVCLVVGVVLLVASAFSAQAVSAATTVRPISDFVSAQGSVLADVGPVAGGDLIVGTTPLWGNDESQIFGVDYAGAFAKGLAAVGVTVKTSFSGIIIERSLPDGRAEDTIHLLTHNALAYMVDASTYPVNCSNHGVVRFSSCPAIFGYNLVEIANRVGRPVLVNSVMNVTLVNTAPGAPIPDIFTVSGTPSPTGAYLQTINLKTIAVGPVRAAFGVPDGTLGLATLDVTGNNITGLDDEQTSLRVLGK